MTIPQPNFMKRARIEALLQPASVERLVDLVRIWKREGRYQPALEIMTWAHCIAPNASEIFFIRGSLMMALGKSDDAIACLQQAADAEPLRLEYWQTLYKLGIRLNRPEITMSAGYKAAALPGCPKELINDTLSWLNAAKDTGRSFGLLRRMALLFPTNAYALRSMIKHYHGTKDLNVFTLKFKQAFILDPDDDYSQYEYLDHAGNIFGIDQLNLEILGKKQIILREYLIGYYSACKAFKEHGLSDGIIEKFRRACSDKAVSPRLLKSKFRGGSTLVRSGEIAAKMKADAPAPADSTSLSALREDGFVQLLSCDAAYFNLFAENLAASASLSRGISSVHIHIVGPAPTEQDLEKVTQQGIEVVYSYEPNPKWNLALYSTLARYLELPKLLREYRADIFVTDCDILIGQNLEDLAETLKSYDIGLWQAGRYEPWLAAFAGFTAIRHSPGGLAFADLMSAAIQAGLERAPFWGLDQAAIQSALAYARANGVAISEFDIAACDSADHWRDGLFAYSGSHKAKMVSLGRIS